MFVIREEQMDAFSRPIQHCSEKSVDETETTQKEYLRVEILDCDDIEKDDMYAEGNLIQYVNLPQNEKWLKKSLDKSPVEKIDRLGQVIRVKVISKPSNIKFKIIMFGKNGNVTYKPGERKRNKNYRYGYKESKENDFTYEGESFKREDRINDKKEFKKMKKKSIKNKDNEWRREWKDYKKNHLDKDFKEHQESYGDAQYRFTIDGLQADVSGEKNLYFRLTAAGGNRYYFLAETSDGSIKSDKSVEIKTCRCLFYQLLFLENISVPKLTMSDFVKAFGKHGIRLIEIGSKEVKIFSDTKYVNKFNIMYSSYNPVSYNQKEKQFIHEYLSSELQKKEKEWQKKGKGWQRQKQEFQKLKQKRRQLEKDTLPNRVFEANYDVIYKETSASKFEPYNVVIVFNFLFHGKTAGESRDRDKTIDTDDRIYITTEHISPQEQTNIIIHEMGHRVGMVPDGSDLNRGSHYYTNRGHRGSHCYKGTKLVENYTKNSFVTYIDGTAIDIPECIMFGSVGVTLKNSQIVRPSTFCNECSEAVKKIDLS